MTEFLVIVSLIIGFLLIVAGWVSEISTNKKIKKLDDKIHKLIDEIGKQNEETE